jgi:hypothetical protein
VEYEKLFLVSYFYLLLKTEFLNKRVIIKYQKMIEKEEKEKWKTIPDYNNYEISNFGQIRNKKKQILKKRILSSGYETIGIYLAPLVRKFHFVHRLVAQTFIPNPENLAYVNHKDRNKSNNKVTNLEWINHSMNIKHCIETGRNTYKRPIRQYDLKNNFIKEFDSITEAASITGCNRRNISTCALGKVKSAGGFIWKYVQEIDKKISGNIPWKEIKDYPNYKIYNNGEIYSKRYNRHLKPIINSGYYTINLYHNNTRKLYYIHILVAQLFCKNSDNKPIVNHKDANKLNNHFTNLEWVNYSENSIHSNKLGLNKHIRRVHQYILENKYLRTFNNSKEAVKFLELKSGADTNIRSVCKGKRKTAYGYKWKYGETLYDYLRKSNCGV